MEKLFGRFLRPFWRMTRGLTLGVQGLVVDEEKRVLLVRHGYRPGWHLPGGGVEWNETLLEALSRELGEETGLELEGEPQLQGVFANFSAFPGDHIAVFLVHNWRVSEIPRPNFEIREQKFVALHELPQGLSKGARNRILEHFEGVRPAAHWAE